MLNGATTSSLHILTYSQGAKPSELVIEACRRNNVDLLKEVIEGCTTSEAATKLLNDSKSVLGSHAYHEAASRGNCMDHPNSTQYTSFGLTHPTDEIIDYLLDQEGFECDPLNKREGDTPLHSAVRWANEQGKENHAFAIQLIEMMLEAGSDPRIRNKAKLKAADLVNPSNKELREAIQKAEYVMQNEGDFVDVEEEEDEGPTGSNSDSDFDEPETGARR